MILYRTLKRMIERGNIEGMIEKLDIFYAADKITEEQYIELTNMLPKEEPVVVPEEPEITEPEFDITEG